MRDYLKNLVCNVLLVVFFHAIGENDGRGDFFCAESIHMF
jgi:hypothetical protein